MDSKDGKRRRSNVGQACVPCRRRRVKCDGVRPSCGTCKVYNDDTCTYDAREDLRKPLSRQQAHALHTRIEDLERLLRDNGIDPSQAAGPSRGRVEDEEDGEDQDAGETNVSDHLVEASGGFQVHGPTSAFRHLAKFRSEPEPTLADDSINGETLGFRRYLPAGIYVSSHDHDLALKSFFRYYASWAQRTHPLRFYEDMEAALGPNPPARTQYYSPMLHLSILAIGLSFCDDRNLQTPAVRRIFAQEAKAHFETEGMSPTLATVQALAHLASYHSLAAEHNLGWNLIGSALRCAMSLGLNLNVRTDHARERNNTFWTVFCQEAVWAPYVGRAVLWPEHTVPPPSIDEELDAWVDDDDGGPSMISTTFQQTVALMAIGVRIMNNLYGIRSDLGQLVRSGTISEISLALTTWLEQLPPALVITSHTRKARPHILMMHLSWAWLVILLHRPFYRPLAGKSTTPTAESAAPASSTSASVSAPGYHAALAVKHCDRAAHQIVSLLEIWHRQHDLRHVPPTALQCCFIAGTTHLLSFASSRSEKRQTEALGRAQKCIQLLSYMAVSWPAALQKQKLLEELMAEYGRAGRHAARAAGEGVGDGRGDSSSSGGQPHQSSSLKQPTLPSPIDERTEAAPTTSTQVAPASRQASHSQAPFASYAQWNFHAHPQQLCFDPQARSGDLAPLSNGIVGGSDLDLSSLALFSLDPQATLPATAMETPQRQQQRTPSPYGNGGGGGLAYDPFPALSHASSSSMQIQSLSPNSQALYEYILQPYLQGGTGMGMGDVMMGGGGGGGGAYGTG